MDKICSKCKIPKPLDNFSFKNKKLRIKESCCKDCVREKSKKYYEENKGRISNKNFIIRDKNQKKSKKYYLKNREFLLKKSKDYYLDNKETVTLNRRKYQSTKEFKVKKNNKRRNRIKNDECFRLRLSLKNRIYFALKGVAKSKTTLKLLGCSLDFFKKYLESKFKEGMNWSNYGINGWHIDHIIPCAVFDLTKKEEQEKCFHYTNMQPLWAKDNILKGKKY